MTKLILDQGLPRSTSTNLTDVGWDVVHVSDIGLQRASDQAILDYARREGRICVTLDADFHMLLALGNAAGPSVIRIRREGLKGDGMARLSRDIWPLVGETLDKGAMVTVTDTKIRVHNLPV